MRADSMAEGLRSCNELREEGKQLLNALEEALRSIRDGADNGKLMGAVWSPLSIGLFDKFLVAAVKGNYIADDQTLRDESAKAGELIAARMRDDRLAEVPLFTSGTDGSYQFGFPGRPIILARNINQWPIAQRQLFPFVQAIRFLDRSLLHAWFERIVALLEKDVGIAQRAGPVLQELLDGYFQYVCYLYVANYGAEPMLIQSTGTMWIQGKRQNRSPTPIDCRLARIDTEDGAIRIDNAFLLGAGAEARIGFVSTKKQRESPIMQELQHQLEDGPRQARVRFQCVSSTWPNRKTVTSKWVSSGFDRFKPHSDASQERDA